MAEHSQILWPRDGADMPCHTFIPWFGCRPPADGCLNCWVRNYVDERKHIIQWGSPQRIKASERSWVKPMTWHRNAGRGYTHPCARPDPWRNF